MSQFLMLCTLMLVTEGLASTVPENVLYMPAKLGESPSCAKEGRNYCDDVENYPEQTILELLKTAPPELSELFSKDYEVKVPEIHSNLRNSSMVEGKFEEQLCRSREDNIRPRAARTLHNEWRYIVNVEGFYQTTRSESCVKERDVCSTFLKPNHSGVCEQKFFKVRYVALHPSGEKLYMTETEIQSCCSCVIHIINK